MPPAADDVDPRTVRERSPRRDHHPKGNPGATESASQPVPAQTTTKDLKGPPSPDEQLNGMGDSEKCPKCGMYEDYAGDGVFLCFNCLGDDSDSSDDDERPLKKAADTKEQKTEEESEGAEEELTGMGLPIMGDADKCSACGAWQDYACDDVFMCFNCFGEGLGGDNR